MGHEVDSHSGARQRVAEKGYGRAEGEGMQNSQKETDYSELLQHVQELKRDKEGLEREKETIETGRLGVMKKMGLVLQDKEELEGASSASVSCAGALRVCMYLYARRGGAGKRVVCACSCVYCVGVSRV